jgi:lauroyl/myristoyl acyltransferase
VNGLGGADCPRIPTNATPECRRPLITLKDVAWFLGVYPFRWIASALPAGAVRLAVRVAEPLCQLLTRQDRKRMRATLARALGPDASESQLRRISQQWVTNGVRRAFDRLARRASGSLPGRNRMDVCRLEHPERAAGGGNGVIIVTGHFFASRIIRLSLTERGCSVLVVRRGKPLDWALGRFGERFVLPRYRSLRSKRDYDSVSTEDPGCVLRIMKQLRSGGLVVITMDSPFSRNIGEGRRHRLPHQAFGICHRNSESRYLAA